MTTRTIKAWNSLERLQSQDRKNTLLLMGVVFCIFFIQLAFGANPFIVLTALLSVTISVIVLLNGGYRDSLSIVGFFFVFNTVTFAMVLKTALLQPLESNLFQPTTSFIIVLLGAIELLLALYIVKLTPVGRPLFKPTQNLDFLKYLAIICFVFGIFFWLLNQKFLINRRDIYYSEDVSFGGFASMVPIFYMSIIAATAHVILSTKGKKSINIWIIVLLGVGILIGIVESRKLELGYTFLSYYLASFYFRRYFTKSQIITFVVFVLFAFFVFGPIVHTFRTQLWFLSFDKRIEFLRDNWREVLQPSQLENYLNKLLSTQRTSYEYAYFGNSLFFIDRFATVQHTDLIVDSVEDQHTLGASVIVDGYEKLLPGILYPQKSTISQADQITWELGLRRYGVIGFPTVPLLGHAYAGLGWIGVLFIPLYIFILLFLILKKIGSNLYQNVYAIFFLVPLLINIQQWTHTQYVYRLLREFPVLVILLLLFIQSFKVFNGALKKKYVTDV